MLPFEYTPHMSLVPSADLDQYDVVYTHGYDEPLHVLDELLHPNGLPNSSRVIAPPVTLVPYVLFNSAT